jgi:hypothetical protein
MLQRNRLKSPPLIGMRLLRFGPWQTFASSRMSVLSHADVRALSARRPKPLRCAVSGLAGANKRPAMSLTIGPHLGVQWQNSGWARAASPVRLLNVTEGQRHDGET